MQHCLDMRLFDCHRVLTKKHLNWADLWNASRFGLKIFERKLKAHPPLPPLVLQNRSNLALNLTKPDKTKYYIPTARMPTSQEAFAWRSSLYNWSNQLCYVLFIPFVQIILFGHLWTIIMFTVIYLHLWWTCFSMNLSLRFSYILWPILVYIWNCTVQK